MPTRLRHWSLVVEDGPRLVAAVEGGSGRSRLRTAPSPPGHDGAAGTAPPDRRATPPNPAAWPTPSAQAAARQRWADRHPTLSTVTSLEVEAGDEERAGVVLEAVGSHLLDAGIRRLDLRTDTDDPLLDQLRGRRWIQGDAGSTTVASLVLKYPWSVQRPALTGAWTRLPPRMQRLGRRISALHPGQLPELARVATEEVRAAVRLRYSPGPPRSKPMAGAPPGTYSFQATRYRTIGAALALVPPTLRSTTFVDVGCGDGRVLQAALEAGFTRVHGRELDPVLADRARQVIGGRGDVEVGDGLIEPFPPDTGVVFLFNPFDERGLARLAKLVGSTLEERPRPMVVVYVNPLPIDTLEDAGMVLVEANPSFSILATTSR